MVILLSVIAVVLLALLACVFLFGFRLGGEHWQSEVARVRLEASQAERQLHDLTRQAIVTMAESVEQRRNPRL